MRKQKILASIVFFIGFLFILFPMISRTYYDIHSREEVQHIQAQMSSEEDFDLFYQQQVNYNQTGITSLENIEMADVSFVEERDSIETNPQTIRPGGDILATLSIPKIDLVYPIYNGATHENLLKGVARIDGTSYPVGGINTNSVIAGHNGLVDRTYFSYIKNLESGDIIEIQNPKELLTYEVYDTSIIDPDDVGALAVIPGQDVVTLLTCTWPPPGNHRYLVYAKRIKSSHHQYTRNVLSTEDTSEENKRESHLEAEENEGATSHILIPSVEADTFEEKAYLMTIISFETIRVLFYRYGNILLIILGASILFYIVFIRQPKGKSQL